MSFWDKFESKQDGIEDTIEFTIRLAVTTLACVILVVVVAMVAGMFVSNDVVDTDKVFEIIGPAFNTIVGAFVGLLGGLSLNANARDDKTPPSEPTGPDEPLDLAPTMIDPTPPPAPMAAPMAAPIAEAVEEVAEEYVPFDENGDGELQPWEIHRHDLRYDANGDGVVDENDFPNWRANIGGGQ